MRQAASYPLKQIIDLLGQKPQTEKILLKLQELKEARYYEISVGSWHGGPIALILTPVE